jgi:hypothetical protein
MVLNALRTEGGRRGVNGHLRACFDAEALEMLSSGAFRAGESRIGAEYA